MGRKLSTKTARAATLLMLCVGLTACGFQLRTFDFQSSVESYALAGKTGMAIAAPLHEGLRNAGVREATTLNAAIVIDLIEERSERRSASTSGQSTAAEYEMSYAVQYRILNGAGDELAPAAWVNRNRVYQIDRGNIVGSSGEQAILREEMMQDVVGQIVRAVDAVARNAAAG